MTQQWDGGWWWLYGGPNYFVVKGTKIEDAERCASLRCGLKGFRYFDMHDALALLVSQRSAKVFFYTFKKLILFLKVSNIIFFGSEWENDHIIWRQNDHFLVNKYFKSKKSLLIVMKRKLKVSEMGYIYISWHCVLNLARYCLPLFSWLRLETPKIIARRMFKNCIAMKMVLGPKLMTKSQLMSCTA
jgi:hypothetical protein